MTEVKDSASLIQIKDLAGLSQPLTKLIESVSLGVGGLYRPLGVVLDAKAESYKIRKIADAKVYEVQVLKEKLVDEQSELFVTGNNFELRLQGSSIETRAIESMINKEVKKQLNIESIVNKASEIIKENIKVSDEPVDIDWMTRFINISQEISNDEMQNLWAKILSDEISNPKTYSLRALDILKNISSNEAKIFNKVVNMSFRVEGRLRVLEDKNYFKSNGLTLDDISILEELNLISSSIFYKLESGKSTKLADKKHIFCIENNTDRDLSFTMKSLTNVGQELSNLVKREHIEENLKNISDNIKLSHSYSSGNIFTYYMNILSWSDDNKQYQYNTTKIQL